MASQGAELIVLQELHNGLYFCQTEDPDVFEQAETIPGPSTTYFGKLAKELGLVIVLSLFEKRAAGLYHNTAVVLEKDINADIVALKNNLTSYTAVIEKRGVDPEATLRQIARISCINGVFRDHTKRCY